MLPSNAPHLPPEVSVEVNAVVPVADLKFEAALAELDQIVRLMEEGRLPLDEALAAYQRGNDLLRHCQQQLSDAERKIQILDGGTLQDFASKQDAPP